MTATAQKSTVIESLKTSLADTYALYLKTQNFHWNVEGPYFQELHGLFETQYTELAAAVDAIAERIRALGEKAPAAFSLYAKETSVKEGGTTETAEEMVRTLASDNQIVSQTAVKGVRAAEEAGDIVSADLLTQRASAHQKAAWMLRSHKF